MGTRKNPYLGRTWDQDYVDLVTEGNFTFSKHGPGYFQFGTVVVETDYSIEEFRDFERVEFSFEGQEEYDPVSGRGWVIIENDTLKGKIFSMRGMD